jgi:hypothetical protein
MDEVEDGARHHEDGKISLTRYRLRTYEVDEEEGVVVDPVAVVGIVLVVVVVVVVVVVALS